MLGGKVQLGSWMSLIWSLKYLSMAFDLTVTLKIALLHPVWMLDFRKDNPLTTEPYSHMSFQSRFLFWVIISITFLWGEPGPGQTFCSCSTRLIRALLFMIMEFLVVLPRSDVQLVLGFGPKNRSVSTSRLCLYSVYILSYTHILYMMHCIYIIHHPCNTYLT